MRVEPSETIGCAATCDRTRSDAFRHTQRGHQRSSESLIVTHSPSERSVAAVLASASRLAIRGHQRS